MCIEVLRSIYILVLHIVMITFICNQHTIPFDCIELLYYYT